MAECVRCGNHLGLGLAILHISTIVDGTVERKICSACHSDLQKWFAAYNLRKNDEK